jgi:hypothetical protein
MLASERMLHNNYDRKGSVKKSLALSLKGFGAKMN